MIKIDTQSDCENYSLVNLLLSNAATNHRVHVRECMHCDIELSWRAENCKRALVYTCTNNRAKFFARIAQIISLSEASRNKTPREIVARTLGNLYKSQAKSAYAALEGLGRLAIKIIIIAYEGELPLKIISRKQIIMKIRERGGLKLLEGYLLREHILHVHTLYVSVDN